MGKIKDLVDQWSRAGSAEKQREKARKAGIPETDPDMSNPFRSPSDDKIAAHIRAISAGRPGVPDNGGNKKKKGK